MKILINIILLFLLSSCQDQVSISIKEPLILDIEKSCSMLEKGMNIEEVDSIMTGDGLVRGENLYREEQNLGFIYFWNIPTDMSKIDNSMRMVVPHGDTCVVRIDPKESVYEITFKVISEDAFYEKSKRTKQ